MKPLFFVKGLTPTIPILSQTRNALYIKWPTYNEYIIPLNDDCIGKLKVYIKDTNIYITDDFKNKNIY